MNEEIEYAEMLEIPVSTVNVVRKKRSKKSRNETPATSKKPFFREAKTPDLKQSVIEQVNDKLQEETPETEKITAEAELFAESANSAGSLDFNEIPQRIDTIRLYSENDRLYANNFDDFSSQSEEYAIDLDVEKDGGRYAFNPETRAQKRVRKLLGVEFAIACALCGGIFLTNVFMPNSAINTFFRSLDSSASESVDERTYADFTLSGVVSAFADTQMNISDAGVLSFTDKGHVYPVADGVVREIVQNEDGSYLLKIEHSESFSGMIGGLDSVYYAVGDEVKSNVPVGYSLGEKEVQVTMYSEGVLLNCFELTEENCLAWVEQE